jgi:hypothetical protein
MKGMIGVRRSHLGGLGAKTISPRFPTGKERCRSREVKQYQGVEPSEKQNRH